MPMYRKRPVTVEARQLIGETAAWMDVYQWIETNTLGPFEPLSVLEGEVPCPASGVSIDPSDGRLIIATLEGYHHANLGDWIIREVAGEFYPCKPEIFAATYEPAEEPSPALTDTIARAIYDDQHGDSLLSLSWDDAIAASRSDRHDAALHGMDIGSARRAARAALAAMPQPIGYAGAWHEGDGWTLDIEYGEYLRPTAAQALKDCSDYRCPIHTVVAVVPVEGNPA